MNERYEAVRAMLAAQPRETLGFFPTPLTRLDRLSAQLGVNLYVKRDDFSGMSLFGGNKIRKLEYLLGDAVAKGCDTVFTYGATQSNHAMQTVTACRRLGLTPILYLNAYVQPDENDVRSNMLLDRILGAEMHIVESLPGETEAQTEARCFAMGREHAARLEAEGHRCYDVPMGGASPVGSCGFIGGYLEFVQQCEDLGIDPDFVNTATGTGGTLAGLTAGHRLLAKRARITAIAVSPKDAGYEARCAALGTQGHMGYLLRAKTGMFTLDDAHTIEEISASADLSELLVPMDRPLAHLPAVHVKPHAERFVRNGNTLTRRELLEESAQGESVRLYLGDRFAGIGRMQGDTMKFDAMLLE